MKTALGIPLLNFVRVSSNTVSRVYSIMRTPVVLSCFIAGAEGVDIQGLVTANPKKKIRALDELISKMVENKQ